MDGCLLAGLGGSQPSQRPPFLCCLALSFLPKANLKTNRITILLEKSRKAQSPPVQLLLSPQCKELGQVWSLSS